MRSSSSELLLYEQCDAHKRASAPPAIVVKKAAAATKAAPKTYREHAWFYTTVTLAVFAVSSGCSLLFLVPLYVDPALSTLVADFVREPVRCVTSRREELTGLMNCSWHSCREGCTSDAYKCVHIYVNYVPGQLYDTHASNTTNTSLWTSYLLAASKHLKLAHASLADDQDDEQSAEEPPLDVSIDEHLLETHSDEHVLRGVTTNATTPRIVFDALLFVNIKGCGYPPLVMCRNFTYTYGVEGYEFPCYYSRDNATVVLPYYNEDEHVAVIVHYFAIPFVITLTTSIALCVMHCDCRCRRHVIPNRGHYHYHHHHHHHHHRHRDHAPDAMHRETVKHLEPTSDSSISCRVDNISYMHYSESRPTNVTDDLFQVNDATSNAFSK